ncbi:starch synthase [Thiocapsa imhoffii]|uniref:Glycogen synthase n=1 Tax=Thiocapsa imhoffii TaxID=382777 RepID=A0A9X0WHE2_9GAMM|nr:glycogen synthase [Thiocapsa imhoffii]MBK1644761.1 starch synthase [Thiocapsa imhoffii]
MNIAMVSAECAPIAKAGGLGDVVHGLARALIALGQQVEVFMPDHDVLRRDLMGERHVVCRDLRVLFGQEWINCHVDRSEVDGIPCVLIDAAAPRRFFARGRIYGEPDDATRFAFFCRAVLTLMQASDRRPDLIHCHDWHTGLLPVLLAESDVAPALCHTPVCYSLHNVGYQGVVDPRLLSQVGLAPASLMTAERLRDPTHADAANLLKGGIVYADVVTTVSPRYAWEIQNTPQGMGLQDLLRIHEDKFGGLLNGLDERVWNPLSDPHLPASFDPEHLAGKAQARDALRARLGLGSGAKPILAIVSRLDEQKGVHLLEFAIRYAPRRGAQVALLGAALDPRIAARFERVQAASAGSADCRLVLAYDEELSHLIYGGADMILIPSLYEPCGLTQMIAMQYGTVPIARRVGGLADTIHDANFSDQPFTERNGYLFDDPTEDAVATALDRAFALWSRHPDYFRQLQRNGMRQERSWHRPAQRYLDIYRICSHSSPY